MLPYPPWYMPPSTTPGIYASLPYPVGAHVRVCTTGVPPGVPQGGPQGGPTCTSDFHPKEERESLRRKVPLSPQNKPGS